MSDEPQELEVPQRNEEAKLWMKKFENAVRRKQFDIEQLRALFHEKVVWFGLETNICADLKQTIEQEFKELWPTQLGFTCDFNRAVVFSDATSISIFVPWVSGSKIAGAPTKSGRATIVLGIFDGKNVRCINGHFSINPITRISKL